MEAFSQQLKTLRNEKKLSLSELARNIGVSDVAVGRWERGLQIPNIENLVLIAKFFGVSTDYLLGLED